MGLDFSKMPAAAPSAATVEHEIETVRPFDIAADRTQMNETYVGSQEVDALVSTIEVNNLETIVSFGLKRRRRFLRRPTLCLTA